MPFDELPEDTKGVMFDFLSLEECAKKSLSGSLRPAVLNSLDRTFETRLDAAAKLTGEYKRSRALAGVSWALAQLPVPDQTPEQRLALARAVNTPLVNSKTALHFAIENGRAGAVRWLLVAGGNPNAESGRRLCCSVRLSWGAAVMSSPSSC